MRYLTLTVLLAEDPSRGPDYGKASPIGLLVVVLLLIAVFALVWSMNRQLKKVPASFDAADAADTTPEAPQTPETPEAPETPDVPDAEIPPGRDG